MEIEVLKKAGLTESQAKGYMALIKYGALTPAELAEKSDESRTNGYAIADKLVSLGLARKTDGSKNTIEAENPTKIRSLIVARQKQLKIVNDELSGVLPSMLSRFRLTSDQPGVITAEGIESLKLVWDEIIASKQDVLIFPSNHDHDDPEIAKAIEKQIQRQRDAKVRALALLPTYEYEEIKSTQDELLVFKKLPEGISFNAQIMVFDNIVVSTVFNHGVVNTIITSAELASTMKNIFYAIWNSI